METREKLSSEKNTLFQINVVQKWQAKRGSKKQEARSKMFSSSNMFSKNGKQREEGVSEASHKSRIGNIGKRKGDLV